MIVILFIILLWYFMFILLLMIHEHIWTTLTSTYIITLYLFPSLLFISSFGYISSIVYPARVCLSLWLVCIVLYCCILEVIYCNLTLVYTAPVPSQRIHSVHFYQSIKLSQLGLHSSFPQTSQNLHLLGYKRVLRIVIHV